MVRQSSGFVHSVAASAWSPNATPSSTQSMPDRSNCGYALQSIGVIPSSSSPEVPLDPESLPPPPLHATKKQAIHTPRMSPPVPRA
jgi:hypothetical protein